MAAVVLPQPEFPHLPGARPFRPRLVLVPPPGPAPAPIRPRREAPAVYRRRRAAVLLGALALVFAVLLALGALPSFSHDATPVPRAAPVAAHSYVVQPGDTLWSIARSLDPAGDPRPVVDQLADRNGGVALVAGQRLDLDGLRL